MVWEHIALEGCRLWLSVAHEPDTVSVSSPDKPKRGQSSIASAALKRRRLPAGDVVEENGNIERAASALLSWPVLHWAYHVHRHPLQFGTGYLAPRPYPLYRCGTYQIAFVRQHAQNQNKFAKNARFV